MSTRRLRNRHLYERSPGELAFDRVLATVAGYVLLSAFSLVPNSHAEPGPAPREITWVAFTWGVAALVLWLWLLRGVVAAWQDPGARVLRFSSSVLLVFAAVVVLRVLRVPFP